MGKSGICTMCMSSKTLVVDAKKHRLIHADQTVHERVSLWILAKQPMGFRTIFNVDKKPCQVCRECLDITVKLDEGEKQLEMLFNQLFARLSNSDDSMSCEVKSESVEPMMPTPVAQIKTCGSIDENRMPTEFAKSSIRKNRGNRMNSVMKEILPPSKVEKRSSQMVTSALRSNGQIDTSPDATPAKRTTIPNSSDVKKRIFVGENSAEKETVLRTSSAKKRLRLESSNEVNAVGHQAEKDASCFVGLDAWALLTCRVCNDELESSESLEEHFKMHHAEKCPYVCHFCLAQFQRHDEFKLHVLYEELQKSLDENFRCSVCQKDCLLPTFLSKHWKHSHRNCKEIRQVPFHCEECDLRFLSYEDFVWHRRSDLEAHSKVDGCRREFHCYECRYDGKSERGLLMHVVRHHEKDSPFQCPRCNLKLKNAGDFLKHLIETEFSKESLCETCGLRFSSAKCSFEHAKNIHGDDGLGSCDVCGDVMFSKAMVDEHATNHWMLKCPYCERKYRANAVHDFSAHVVLHKSDYFDENSVCFLCDTDRQNRKALSDHIRSVHGKKYPFNCPKCNENHATELLYNDHIAWHKTNAMPFVSSCPSISRSVILSPSPLKSVRERSQSEQSTPLSPAGGKRRISNRTRLQRNVKPRSMLRCDLCDYKAGDAEVLRYHEYLKHGVLDKTKFYKQCNVCKKEFVISSMYEKHLSVKHGIKSQVEEGRTSLIKKKDLAYLELDAEEGKDFSDGMEGSFCDRRQSHFKNELQEENEKNGIYREETLNVGIGNDDHYAKLENSTWKSS
ncbi:unnamed protein product [Notodromas monacha]|uniref:C2H2-type domain-containing protein n=1 Tax=Notodromas monacha TaxID=399045 RepID=A0A7R9BGG8_9CRUS|nr:unnamed protein product [Notodromas monacha]CAG0915046.1 unnamed protein product [Notodromas monacha]